MSTVRDNLIAARALIDTPEKWLQGWFEGPNGTMDASEAVCRASGEDIGGDAYEAMCLVLPDGIDILSTFNDDPDTTHADIMALFDRAIAAQENTP